MGRSVRGEVIRGFRMGAGPDVTLFLGVHHGDEPLGRDVLERLRDALGSETERLGDVLDSETERLYGRAAVFVPVLNPDGLAAGTRFNARGVDLNRNLPTRDWRPDPDERKYPPGPSAASEPETRALMALVEGLSPAKIVTLHAPLHCVNWNGLSRAEVEGQPSPAPRRHTLEDRPDGRAVVCAEALGEAMAARNGYSAMGDIGYPCPGSFGTWAGHERRIATITLELRRDVDADAAWSENRDALLAALAY